MKIRSNYISLFVLLCLFCLTSCSDPVKMYPNKRVLKVGDDPSWSSPALDDSDWDQSGGTDTMGIFWVRFEIKLNERKNLFTNKAASVISLGSYEAYWDNELIYKSGKVGKSAVEEIPGKFLSEFIIPDSLCTIGKHHVAFRVSNFSSTYFRGSWNSFHMVEFGETQKRYLQLTAIMFILGGGYLLAAFYYLLMFFGRKKDMPNLIFSLMCFFFFRAYFYGIL